MRISLGDYGDLFRRYIGQQRAAAVFMALLLLASIGLQLVAPQVARRFIDAVGRSATEQELVALALLFIGAAFVQQILRVLALYWSEHVAWSATNALRADLTAHLLRLDMSFHTARTPGELIERVDGDVQALAGFFSSFVVQLVGSVLLLCGVLGAVALVDWRLGVAYTLFALLAFSVLGWVRQFATPHWHGERERSAAYYGYLGEIITAAEDLRASGAVPFAMRRFYEHLRHWLPVSMRASLWGSLVWVCATVIFAFGTMLAYWLGGSLFLNSAISLGAVYLVVAYTAMLAEPIETIRTQIQDLQRADASIARVQELFAINSRLANGMRELPEGALAVRFEGVSFAYDDVQPLAPNAQSLQPTIVLNEIDFDLAPGRVLGVLGRTGSGKTTLARLLFRQYDPQQGAVRLGGLNVRDLRLASLRARVGMVTQDVQLFEASLRDNMTFFDPNVSDEQLLDVIETLGLRAWFQRLPRGLDTLIDGGRLSAGEAQLIALARVFIKNPGLVILDEASSRLDPATEALLERALDRLLAGRTAIIIAHRLATLARVDEILILERGQIVEHGSRAQLAADPASRFAVLNRTRTLEVLV